MLQWVTSRIARAGLVLLIGICGPAGTGEKVRAQDAGEDHDSERSQRATEPVPYLLDTITVFAERTTKHVLDVPATVTVIDRADIEKRMVRDIDDLTRYEPGIKVDRRTSRTDPFSSLSGFAIRGVSGNRVMIMVDGTRIQEMIVDGTRDFVDTNNMKAVEIIRGPASVLWGSDALGGIVAFRTKDPDDYLREPGKNFAGQADTSYDTFDGSWVKSVTVAGQNGPWQALLSGSHRNAHEPRLSKARADGGIWGCPRNPEAIRCNELDPLRVNAYNGLGKIVYRPSSDHEFKLTGEVFDRQTDVDQKYDLGAASGGYTNLSYRRHQHLTRSRATLTHEWLAGLPFLDNVRWQLSYSPQERTVTGERLRRRPDNDLELLDYLLKYNETFWEGDAQFKSSFDLAGTVHNLTYGYYGNFTATDYRRRDILTNLGTGGVTITEAGGFNFANADTIRSDGYIQDEIALFDGRLTITPGLRYAYYKISPRPDQNYVAVPGKEPREIDAAELTKKVGAIFKIDQNYSVYAQYGEGFKMPTAQQLFTSLPLGIFNLIPNPDLRPERVKAYEAGVRGRFERGYFSISAFYSDYDDFIQNFVFISATDITYANLSKVKIWGIEAFAEHQVLDNLFVNVALSYQYGNQIASQGADEVPFDGASPLTVVAGLRYVDPGIGLTGEFIGTFADRVRRVSSPTLFKPAGYAVFDTIWSWKPRPNFTLRMAVNNIFDTRYFKWPMPGTYSLNPSDDVKIVNPLELQTQPGRTYRIGMSVTW